MSTERERERERERENNYKQLTLLHCANHTSTHTHTHIRTAAAFYSRKLTPQDHDIYIEICFYLSVLARGPRFPTGLLWQKPQMFSPEGFMTSADDIT